MKCSIPPRCSTVSPPIGPDRDEGPTQDFPTTGPLASGLNLTLAELKNAVNAREEATVYLYVVRSATWEDARQVNQSGSAPNFQGGLITLCTCKHSMRAGRRVSKWPDTWVAGLTSSINGS